MADFLSIQVSGLGPLMTELRSALSRLERPGDLMEALGAELEANIERRFDTKKDPDGQPWADLAESTLARYEAEDDGARRGTILERTGQMRNSLTSNAGDDWVEVGMNRLTDGGAWVIPLLHETGTTRMPRRGIFLSDPDNGALGSEDEADLQRVIEDWLADLFDEG